MSVKIKNNGWLAWAVSVAVVVVVIIVMMDLPRYATTPWQLATKVAIDNAISKFGTEGIDAGIYKPEWFYSLGKMVLLVVLGPVFWMIGEIRAEKGNADTSKKGFFWFVGTIFTMLGLVVGLMGSVMTGKTYYNIHDEIALEKKGYALTKQMNLVGFDLYEYYHLPERFGGGSGSYKAFSESGEHVLNHLENYSDTLPGDFVIGEVEEARSITFYIVGPAQGRNPNFENINGKKGYMQAKMSVYPVDERMEFDRQLQNTF